MSTPSGDTPAGPAPSKISHWDFMLFRQHDALLHYLSRLAALDARDGSALVSKVLDQRVEQSVRFRFHNPVIGAHGYYHVLVEPASGDKVIVPKGTTPLHFAVRQRLSRFVTTLLEFGADPTLQDDDGETALQLAIDIFASSARASKMPTIVPSSDLAPPVTPDAQQPAEQQCSKDDMMAAFKWYREASSKSRAKVAALEQQTSHAVADLQKAKCAVDELESSRQEFRTRTRQDALRAIVLMQWKFAIGLVRTQRTTKQASAVVGESRLLRKQLELAIQEKRALFEEKREQAELCNSLRIEVSDLQRELEERGSGGKRNDKQTKQMQQAISVAEERAEQAEKQVKELTAALKKAKKSHLGSKSPVSGSDVVLSECEQCIEHTNVEAQLREDVADLESALKAAQELFASERERADTAEQQAARVQDLERLVRKMRAANVKGAIDSSATDEVAAQQLPLRSDTTLVIASNAPNGCCSVS